EALAAVVRVLEAGALEHRPPGAVEHEDPLAEKCFESVARFSHVSLPCPKRWEPEARGLFRRFLAWSPSCLQSFPGRFRLALSSRRTCPRRRGLRADPHP